MLNDIEKLNINANNNEKYIKKDIDKDKNEEKEINKNSETFNSD